MKILILLRRTLGIVTRLACGRYRLKELSLVILRGKVRIIRLVCRILWSRKLFRVLLTVTRNRTYLRKFLGNRVGCRPRQRFRFGLFTAPLEGARVESNSRGEYNKKLGPSAKPMKKLGPQCRNSSPLSRGCLLAPLVLRKSL